MKENKKRKNKQVKAKLNDFARLNAILNSTQASETDPNGSYTGVTLNPHDRVIQDSDDL